MPKKSPQKPLTENEKREQFHLAELQRKAKNGSAYFYWIAFFALLNQVMDKLSTERTFVFGLGIPQYVSKLPGMSDPALLWGMIIGMAVIFAVFGFFAQRRNIPIYIVGIVFYFVDMVFSILVQDVVSTVMHIVFLVMLIFGLIAAKKLLSSAPSQAK